MTIIMQKYFKTILYTAVWSTFNWNFDIQCKKNFQHHRRYAIRQVSHGQWTEWSSAGLKMHIHAYFFRRAISTPKVSQSDLVLGVRSRWIGGLVHARLQVSVCSCYDLFHPGKYQTNRQHYDQLI